MQYKNIGTLQPGDVIRIWAPYEENTREYYNGYHPIKIRGHLYEDKFGRKGKSRNVIYMGHDGKDLLYLTLTTSHTTFRDTAYQYQLQDNSMTYKEHDDIVSFVETLSIRAVRPRDESVVYNGHLNADDWANIMHRIVNNSMQYYPTRDIHGIIPKENVSIWENELYHMGYQKEGMKDNKQVYTKQTNDGKHRITRSESGYVYYHHKRSIEHVQEIVAYRESHIEGCTNDGLLTFKTAVNQLSNPIQKQKNNSIDL